MRRRSKRTPNTSESTGKVGQELPKTAGNQPAPLRPVYPDDSGEISSSGGDDPSDDFAADDAGPETTGDAEGESAGERSGRKRRRRRRRGSSRPGVVADPPAASAAGVDPSVTPAGDTLPGEGDDAAGAEEDSADDLDDTGAVATGKLEMETQPDQLSTPPEQAPAVAPRSPRGFVVLAIGLPGSGKTTWFKRRGVLPLSSDMLRSILFDDITEQRYQGLVFSTLRSLLRARLVAKMPWNYVDATNLSPHERRQWIKMAKSFGYEVQAVFFDVPLEVCLQRNQKRERRVSDETISAMAQRLRPPHFREGFSKITVVRVKAKDGVPESNGAPPAEHPASEPEAHES